MRVQLLTNQATTGTGPIQQMLRDSLAARVNQGVCHVEGISGDTFVLQGRADPSAAWETIWSTTSNGIQAVQLMREMRGSLTRSAGTVNAWLNV